MRNKMNKEIRLFRLIKDKNTCDNLIRIYKSIKGEQRLFLKTFVWASLNPYDNNGISHIRYITPEVFFSPQKIPNNSHIQFTKQNLEYCFKMYKQNKSVVFFGHNMGLIFGKIV